MILRAAIAAVLAVCAAGASAHAAIVSKTGAFAGTPVEYKVSLPPGYNPQKAYPVVLVFTGGGQALAAAQSTLEVDWQGEADKRGYVVISPAAPGGDLFFETGDRVFPAFLDMIREDYKVAGKIHIAGHSNGGLSAFHIAARYPDYFSTVTGYPGLWQDNPEAAFPSSLRGMCMFMHVGDMDPDWRTAMEAQARDALAEGYRIKITVEKNQTHRIKAAEVGLSRRLFEEIESCR